MIIKHRIVTNATIADTRRLAELGVSVDPGFAVIEVDESADNWSAMISFAREKDALVTVRTLWSESEIEAAPWLSLKPTWHHGYPQPEVSYWESTYAEAERCRTCGIRGIQAAPFRMRHEPKWGRRWVMQLNWEFDEYFVRRDIWESRFAPLGLSSREVLHAKSGRQLETVVQWDIGKTRLVSLQMEGVRQVLCARCERPKHLPFTRGCLPTFEGMNELPDAGVVRSKQWFGDGGSAFRAILISQRLRRALGAEHVNGWSYYRVCDPST